MQKQKILNRDEWVILILGLSVFLGLLVRIFPAVLAGFPINDGGMFLVMIRDLKVNHFLLPEFTSYNYSGIPYAYPPLGFYLAAGLSNLGFSELTLLRWLPALINIISIYAVFLLAGEYLTDRPRAALAAGLYALIPGGYAWFIMGGGLTRGLGGLFLVLSIYMLLRVFRRNDWKDVAIAMLFTSLAVISHPEAGLHAAASCALVWMFYGRSRAGILQAALIAAGTIFLTSPWWLTVLQQHGIETFVSAFHSGMYGASPLLAFFRDFFARGSLIPTILILRLLGVAWGIWRGQYFLLAWMVLPYFVEPRSAPAVSYYPFVILTAIGFADSLFTLITWLKTKRNLESTLSGTDNSGSNPSKRLNNGLQSAWFKAGWLNITMLTLFFYLFLESLFYTFPLVNTSLKPSAIQAMEWIRDNTSVGSKFLVLRGESGAMVDPVQEWFPALAERRSQTTLQGLEWTLAGQFMTRLGDLYALQACGNVDCVEDWSARSGLEFTHLYVEKVRIQAALHTSISESPDYDSIYENPEIIIYQAYPR